MKTIEEGGPLVSHSVHDMAAHLEAAVFCPTTRGDLASSLLVRDTGSVATLSYIGGQNQ